MNTPTTLTRLVLLLLLASTSTASAQDVNVITAKQKEDVINAIRKSVKSKFEDKWGDDKRDEVVNKAKEAPWEHVPDMFRPRIGTFGRLHEAFRKAETVAITPKGRGVVILYWQKDRDGWYADSKFPVCLDKFKDAELKVGEKAQWSEGKDIFLVTGQVEVDKKKVWRAVRVEFNEKDKARIDPRKP